MSKTFVYLIVTIAVYLVIVKGLGAIENDDDNESNKTDSKNGTKNGTGLNDNENENGVSRGAAGRMRHGIGYTN